MHYYIKVLYTEATKQSQLKQIESQLAMKQVGRDFVLQQADRNIAMNMQPLDCMYNRSL